MKAKTIKRALAIMLCASMIFSLFTGVVMAQDLTESINLYEAKRITIHPGTDETRLNFSWHSEEQASPATVRIKAQGAEDWTVFVGESNAVVTSADGYQEGYHDTFVKNCGHTCSATCGHEACTASECYHGIYADPYYNRVTVSGLQFGVIYTYQLGNGTDWSKEYTTKTADSDPSKDGFEYLVFGDSQTADQYYGDYMKKALELAVEKFDGADFFMNLGDNIHENNNRNYNAYFTAQDILAQYPMAVVMGNHELNLCTNNDKTNFSNHPALTFTNPPAADSRQDYWFRYGDVLFITFNSGPQLTSMMEDLEQLIKDAKAAHPDTMWTILQTHQGFYANNGGGKVWRKDFTSVLQKYDIDVFFNGHHHLYTRTESLVFDSAITCSHEKGNPVFDCAACSGSVEPLGENDVTVQETYIASDGVTAFDYNKTVERTDPEGTTFISLDSLTAEGHDQYITSAGSVLAATSAFAINTVEGQGAITKVSVTNDQLKIETFWINNNGTPRITNSADIALLDDDYIEDTPYDTYTIKKTTPVKEVEVTFDGGTDRGIFTKRINVGETVAEPSNPIMVGKSFKYWTADGETPFDFATTFSSDTTLTAVYEEIPATTTAQLFVEAVNRGDKEIIVKSDITLTDCDAITISSGTTIKCAEGERYTITLDTNSRLVTAAGSTVTFENINITLATTITTQSSGYNSGGFIKVGGSSAKLYIKNCIIHCAATSMGGSNNAIIRPYANNYSRVYIENSTVSSNTNNSAGALIGGLNATFYVTDSTLKPKASNYWLSADNPTLVLKGNSTYSGWCSNTALKKIYNFANASVKISRNADNLIELTKIGSGVATSNANYKIYYALEDTAFANGTAIEYTEPIANIDYETPVYAAIYYTGTSYYGDINFKTCGEYVEGVAVNSSDAFVAAINGGESLITLTSDIVLNNLGNLSIGADTVIQSLNNKKLTITLDGSTRLTVSTGKKATLKSLNIIIAETIEKIDDPDNEAYYYGYITVRNNAKLYIFDSHIEAKAENLGCSTASMIKIYREDPNNGYVHVERSTVVSPSGQNKGIAFSAIRWTANTKPTFRIVDSTITGNWVFYQGYHILEGSTEIKGVGYSTSNGTVDLRNSSVTAVKTLDGGLELVKTGSVASNEEYKIYYSTDKAAFELGTATEYTAPIKGLEADTPIYVAIGKPITYLGTTNILCGISKDDNTTVNAGDVEQDGVVNSTDLVSLRKQLLINSIDNENIADANRDGQVNIIDLISLKKYIVNIT